MESLLRSARRILDRHPAPALPFGELHRLVSEERAGPSPDPDLLLDRMRARPRRFRILDPWRGPWRPVARSTRRGRARQYRRRLRRAGAPLEVWVVAPPDADGTRARAPGTELGRLRESLRWLAWTVDEDSPRALVRWLALLAGEARLRRRLASADRLR